MSELFRAVRGMHDILPQDSGYWQWLEDQIATVLHRYGYAEIRMPLVESSHLFQRSIGEVTDIVAKEMYSFEDRGGDQLSLRPEGTAGCVRAVIEHGLIKQAQRLWYQGPMFRRERPQRGRYRQFHQIGVEVFGLQGPDIDLEILLLIHRILKTIGLQQITLELNSLGDLEERTRYRNDLVAFLQQHESKLDEDSRHRLLTNPLRILDSKDPHIQELVIDAPVLIDYLNDTTRDHFNQLCAGLQAAKLPFTINPRLVRGLDYYNRTVFEWTTDQLGAQGTICAGGRYDGLVEQLGGPPTAAIGFALGVERLLELLVNTKTVQQIAPATIPHVYVIAVGDAAQHEAMQVAERLRDAIPTLRIVCHCGGGRFKNQLKKADRSGAQFALLLGDDELAQGHISIKWLRDQTPQQQVSMTDLVPILTNALHGSLAIQ
jgi:histidyl-tRNA synthetase